MKNQTCCFTGHRKISFEKIPSLREKLVVMIEYFIKMGIRYFGCGGVLGFDTIAAQSVIECRKRYPHIRLILILPCKEQDRFWLPKDQAMYKRIIGASNKVVYTSSSYYNGCMQKRNCFLVDNSSICVCYLTEETGGTAYTVSDAARKKCTIINLASINRIKSIQ